MKDAASAGLWLNFTFDELSPLLGIDPANMYKAIRTVGPEHCTLSSDAGEPLFPNSVESLRLLRGIEAGRDAGGQHGGQQSAALLVYEDRSFAHVDLRVDVHPEPVGELRRVFDAYRPAIPYYNLRQVDARVPPLPDWLRDRPR